MTHMETTQTGNNRPEENDDDDHCLLNISCRLIVMLSDYPILYVPCNDPQKK